MNARSHIAVLRSGLAAVVATLLVSCSSGGADVEENPPPDGPPQGANPAGLDARPTNTSCVAPERATGSTTIGTERVFPNLKFSNQPIYLLQAPGDGSKWYVPERYGTIRVFDNKPDVATMSLFLDIDDRSDSTCAECGLLGMAFHPDWPSTPLVYVSYTTNDRPLRGPNSQLSEFISRDGGLTLDPASERKLFTVPKESVHHHAGRLNFGPDGYLYMSIGDGNSFKNDNGQRLNTLLGKMIRIDVTSPRGTAPYKIPADNPFASSTSLCNVDGTSTQNCPEIYAWGFRNPWSWSFDRETGDLWVGDVGESAIEEVNRVKRGGNYGWRCFEGTADVSGRWATGANCSTRKDLLPPIAQYSHSLGTAVMGGYVYRGKAIPSLRGRYLFADFSAGRIWDIPNDTEPTLEITSGGLDTNMYISSFGEDQDGELYVTNIYRDLHRITGAAGGGGKGPASKLSATGCVDPANATLPSSGLIPFTPSATFWSDGAAKERWIALPEGQSITVKEDGDFEFPNGTVLMKNFRLDNRLIETRLFMRHPDGVWAGYSYEWNAEQTDATLLAGGKTVSVGGQQWIYPSEGQCMQCHTEAAGRSLGIETKQLATTIKYPKTGRDANQLVTLNSINVFATPIANAGDETPYPNPYGTAGTVAERAKAYLHTNCSQCHRPNGPTSFTMDLRYSTPLASMGVCDVAPGRGDLGITNARIIAPGAAARSVLIARMSRRDVHEMPPLGSLKVDADGAALLTEWVNSLTSCN